MRLISMQKGGDLAAVYARLVKGATEVGKKLPFSRHRRLGYLTFCPTNLGTTIRASVHARFPKLNTNLERFQEIANMYNLQVRDHFPFPFHPSYFFSIRIYFWNGEISLENFKSIFFFLLITIDSRLEVFLIIYHGFLIKLIYICLATLIMIDLFHFSE